jgi:hypothetical protein
MIFKRTGIFILIITASLTGANPERGSVIVLSTKVGAEINYIENIYYEIFPDVKNLYSAQFILINESQYGVRLIYWDPESLSLKRDAIFLNEDVFEKLKNKVDLTPFPTERDVNRITGKYVILKQIEIFRSLPVGTHLKLYTVNSNKYRGILLEHREDGLVLFDGSKEFLIPYLSVQKGFRIESRQFNPKLNTYVYWGSAISGAAAAYYISQDNSTHVRNFKITSGAVGLVFVSHIIKDIWLTHFPKYYKLDIIWNKDN